jgi:hypothetical protein
LNFLGVTITESAEVMEIHSDWHTPFMIYLRTDREFARRQGQMRAIVLTGRAIHIGNDDLYRRCANGTLTKCITPKEGQIILQDVHAGVYRSHTGAKSLMGKTYR